MLTPLQQAFEYIKKSRNILIVLPEFAQADAVSSGLALFLSLKKMGKSLSLVSARPVSEKLSFLPSLKEIKTSLQNTRDFIISVKTEKNKVEKLRYETGENEIKIILTAQGQLEKNQIELSPGLFKYELIITIGAPDLESLGQIFEQNTELFFNQPVLNIDHQSSNEGYGQINLINASASSNSEIISQLLESLEKNLIDKEIATCLLTGLIQETKSFQSTKTKPQTLILASVLINKGADKEKIVESLYQSKPLSYLRLWGRAATRLKVLIDPKSVILTIKSSDFEKTETSYEGLGFVLEETVENFPNYDFWILLWQQSSKIKGIAQAKQPEAFDLLKIEGEKTIRGNKLIFSLEGKTLEESSFFITDLLKSSF